ncbi:MAG: class I SAM-dependent methyltransferase [bacterium]|nr:class I SAM-dependent methyltransferase [bacterium]
MLDPRQLQQLFGRVDIYVFDQLARGNIVPGMRIFDAGCGSGRNLVYFMRAGFEVMGLDRDPRAVAAVQDLARELAPSLPADAFRVESLEASKFPDDCADVVLCNAVLHFARDHDQFDAELDGAWRLLAPGGLFFARVASSIGIEDRVIPRGGGRFMQPDGSELYLVDLDQLLAATERLGGELVDPIKTTNVQGLRCMTTWVMRKRR